MTSYSRRKFLRTSAVTGAGAAALAASVNAISPYIYPESFDFEQNHSHWSKALPSINRALQTDLSADVTVIGGGFTGLSTALFCKQQNPALRVALLEAQRCGNGASGRNGAMLLTLTDERYMEWQDDVALNRRIYDLTADNIRRLQKLAADTGIDAEIDQRGALQVCNDSDYVESARQFAERARNSGFPIEYWDKNKTAEALGTRLYEGSLFDPNGGQLHPGKLIAVFKRATESAGVDIYEQTPVIHIEDALPIRLLTRDGHEIRTTSVVLATNAYTSKLGYLRRAVTPIFDYVGITAPLDKDQLDRIGWRSRLPFNDSRTEVFYLGLTADNRIHIGGGPVDYLFNNGLREPLDAARRYQALQLELGRIFPPLSGIRFETQWSGIVDMSLDQTPAVGVTGKNKNLYYALGFSGHGVTLSSVFGRILADLIQGKSSAWEWLPYLNRLPAYIPNEPFRWLGVQLALSYYRLRDSK